MYESKTNKTFIREIPRFIYDKLMKLKEDRKLIYDDDPDGFDKDLLTNIFPFRSRQAAHKRLTGLKKKYPILADWSFG